jgi:hypothetical protein
MMKSAKLFVFSLLTISCHSCVDAFLLRSVNNKGIAVAYVEPSKEQKSLQSSCFDSKIKVLSMALNNISGIENTSPAHQRVPKFLFLLNSSTKWILTAISTILVWSAPHKFQGPFIVVGSIAAIYISGFLKKVFNQERPQGSYMVDPGMPSSHALVSFFLAVSLRNVLVGLDGLIFASAASISLLRIICGYHSMVQIVVGASIGSVLGYGWTFAGEQLYFWDPKLAWGIAWSAYLLGSMGYILHRMRQWIGEDKHI